MAGNHAVSSLQTLIPPKKSLVGNFCADNGKCAIPRPSIEHEDSIKHKKNKDSSSPEFVLQPYIYMYYNYICLQNLPPLFGHWKHKNYRNKYENGPIMTIFVFFSDISVTNPKLGMFYSVQTRGILKTSGFRRGACKDR